MMNQSSDTEKLDFLWKTHSYLADYARFADTKAAFAGTLSVAMIGCLYKTGCLKFGSLCTWTWKDWLCLAAVTLLCTVVVLAITTVYPRLKRSKDKALVFWGNIDSHDSLAAYTRHVRAQTTATLVEAMTAQTYTVARYVCVPKYRRVSLCLIALAAGLALSGLRVMLS